MYSAPYSKTHIINKHSKESLKVFPLSQINTLDDGDNSVENTEKVAAASSSSDTKVSDTTHEHIVEGENKVMLVTPSYQLLANNSSNNNSSNNKSKNNSNNSYEVLTEQLTLHDIHNFTYEGFNLVDLYRNKLDRKRINI